jgi:hypothetical protein
VRARDILLRSSRKYHLQMGKKFDVRVTISVDGQARTLFSVKDPPSGEMLLSRKKTDTLRPNGLNPQSIPVIQGMLPRIKEQRYSIHPSRDSSDANLLKSTNDAHARSSRVHEDVEHAGHEPAAARPIPAAFCHVERIAGR